MALSGSVKTSTYGSMGLIFSWTATQNIANNTSTIKWTLKSFGRESTFYYKAGNFKVVIDGATAYSSSDRISLYGAGKTQVASGSKTITHNADGTRTFNVSVEAGIYTVAVNCTGSATFTLDKIARTPNAPTKLTITAGHGDLVGLGDKVTLKWSGASGVITGYQIRFKRGNSGWKDFSGGSINSTATSGTFTDSFTSTDIAVNGAGNEVQYAIRAKNGDLASAWCYSNILTISGKMMIRVSNAWKNGSTWIKVNGEWKRAKRVWIKVNGTWEEA